MTNDLISKKDLIDTVRVWIEDKADNTTIFDLINAAHVVNGEAEWISVNDRLPEDDCRVIAATWITLTGEQHIDIASYRSGGQYFDMTVTNWKPLPLPPTALIESEKQ